ncbi:MAG: c-type cytochrome [Acetobacteraceae bacterium]
MNRLMLTALIAGSVGLASAAQAAPDAAAGKAKATNCGMCHGATGGGTPMGSKLAGEDPVKFIQAMNDYKSGKRDNSIMKNQASMFSADDIANLAAYYASLK